MLLTRWNQSFIQTLKSLPATKKSAPRPGYHPGGSRVDVLEDRIALSTIQWVNRGATSGSSNDRFTEVFGTGDSNSNGINNAEEARRVVDAAILSWQRVITNFNNGTSVFEVKISLRQNGTGFGGSGGVSRTQNGQPTKGFVDIDRGNDTNGDEKGDGGGWFVDPTPLDSSEFTGTIVNAFAGTAQTGSPAAGTSDLYTLVLLELTHALGIINPVLNVKAGSKLQYTGHSATGKVEGSSATIKYWVFDGNTVDMLLVGDAAQGSAATETNPHHSAGPIDGQPLIQEFFKGTTYSPAHDVANGVYEGPSSLSGTSRYLVPNSVAMLLSEVYGYEITMPETFGTFYATRRVLTDGTRQVLVRGAPDGVQSADDILITRVVRFGQPGFNVSVDIGADVPGTGPTDAFVSFFREADIDSIRIESGDGDDVIQVETDVIGIPGRGPLFTIDAGKGDDSINFSRLAQNMDNIRGSEIDVNGGDGDDLVVLFDAASVHTNYRIISYNPPLPPPLTQPTSVIQRDAAAYIRTNSERVAIFGSDQTDTYRVTPSVGTRFTFHARDPATDSLYVDVPPTADPTLTRTSPGSGSWAFQGFQPVAFSDMEILFLNDTPTGSPFLDDQINEAFDLGSATESRSRNGESIEIPVDVDMMKLTVTAGQRIAFDIDRPTGSSLDSYLRLFDSAGNELAGNDDGPTPSESASPEAYVAYTFSTAGTYFVGVSGFGNTDYDAVTGTNATSGSTGSYTLTVTTIDADDQLSEAFPLGPITTTTTTRGGQSIETLTDVDILSFTVTAGQRVAFDVDQPVFVVDDAPAIPRLDSYLRLFNSSGTQLAANDDGNAFGEAGSLSPYLEFTFATAGTYYVGISGFPNTRYNLTTGTDDVDGSIGAYLLHLTSVVDPDDEIREAVALGSMTTTRVRDSQGIQTLTDVDLASFTVTAGQIVAIDLDRPIGSLLDSYLRVFNSSGTQLAANNNGTAPGETASGDSYIQILFPTAGTYYVGVSGFNNSLYIASTGAGDVEGSMGRYSLTLSVVDHDDQIAEAIPVAALNQVRSVTGQSLETVTDVDIYAFSVTAGQQIAIDLDRPTGSSLDSYLRLFHSSGAELNANDDGPTPDEPFSRESYVEHTFATAGTYYLAVSGFSNTGFDPISGEGDVGASLGAYTLSFTPVSDLDDQISEAFPLGAVTQTRTRTAQTIDRLTDVDLISFIVSDGQTVTFDVDLPAGSSLDSYLRLFNSSGTELAANDDGLVPGEEPSFASYFAFEFATAGTYYLGVSGYSNTAYSTVTGNNDTNGSAGAYALTVSTLDRDDQLSEAFDLDDLTQTRTRTDQAIDNNEDVDMVSFPVAAGQRIAFDIDRPSGSLNSLIRLFDGSGTQLASNDNAAAPGETVGIDSYLEFTFAAAGTYFLGVSGAPNGAYNAVAGDGDAVASTTGVYTLVASVIDIDDQISEAFALGAMSQTRTRDGLRIEAQTDVDMMSFTVVAGQRIAFDLDRTTGSGLDSFLRVFNPAGTSLGSNDDGRAPGEVSPVDSGLDSYLEVTFPSAGTFYVGVSGNANTTYNPLTGDGDVATSLGNYALTLSVVDLDDQISEAFALGALTETRTRTGQAIDNAADVDMMSFTVTTGQRVAFDVDRTSGALDSYLRLFNATGIAIATNNDAPAPGEGTSPESYLEFSFAAAGTFYVGISGNSNTAYDPLGGQGDTNGSAGAYTLTLSLIDPDDQISEAFALGAMTEGRVRSGESIEALSDVDMVSFTVAAGQRIAFDVDRPVGSGLNSLLRVFNASGTQVTVNDNAAAPGETLGTESYLEFTFTTAGTFYAAVSGAPNSGFNPVTGTGDTNASTIGAYTLALSVIDIDDQISEAVSLGTLSTSVSRAGQAIESLRDVDLLSFSVAAGQLVAFDIDRPTDSSLDSYLRLFNASGTQLIANDNRAAPDESAGTESYFEFPFTTAGTFYLGVSGFSNTAYNPLTGDGDVTGSVGGYTLAITVINDADDQISEAFALGAMTQERTRSGQAIERPIDVDMMSVTVAAGQRLAFDIDRPSGSTLDSQLRVFTSAGTELATNNNAAAPGETFALDSYVEVTFASAGTYYVAVSGSPNAAYHPTTGAADVAGSVGAYTLTVSILDLDDQISEAASLGSITTSVTRSGQSIEAATDVDMVSFTASAGQLLTFDIDRPSGSNLDSYLRVFTASGTELFANDNAPGPGEADSPESYLERTFDSAGTYYVGVSGFDNIDYDPLTGVGDQATGSTGAYTLIVSVAGLDSNDQISEAISLGDMTQERSRTGLAIDPATDVDMLSFTVTAGQRIAFDLDRPSGSSFDSYLRLFNSSGTQLHSNDNGAAPGEPSSISSYFEFPFPSSGTFYIGVSGFNNSNYSATTGSGDTPSATTGSYSLFLTPLDTDDQISEAIPLGSIAPNQSRSGLSIGSGTDVDMFSFTVSAGQHVGFDVDRPSGSLDSYLRLFTASGTELASNDNRASVGEGETSESYFQFLFASAGTYYVAVSGSPNSGYSPLTGLGDTSGSTGAYELHLFTVFADFDDQISEAFALGSVNNTSLFRSGQQIEIHSDVDMLSFTVSVGNVTVPIPQRVAIDIDRSSGIVDTYLRLFDSTGSQLAFSDDNAAPGEVLVRDSYLEFTFTVSGTYYLGVSAFDNRSYDPVSGTGDATGNGTGFYSITVTNIPNVASLQMPASLPASRQLPVLSKEPAPVVPNVNYAVPQSASIRERGQVSKQPQSELSIGDNLATKVIAGSSFFIHATELTESDERLLNLIDNVMGTWGISDASLTA